MGEGLQAMSGFRSYMQIALGQARAAGARGKCLWVP
jgi:hypothetical protein